MTLSTLKNLLLISCLYFFSLSESQAACSQDQMDICNRNGDVCFAACVKEYPKNNPDNTDNWVNFLVDSCFYSCDPITYRKPDPTTACNCCPSRLAKNACPTTLK